MSLECLAQALALPALGTSFVALVVIGSLKLLLDATKADDRHKDWKVLDEDVVVNWMKTLSEARENFVTELKCNGECSKTDSRVAVSESWIFGAVVLLLSFIAPAIPCFIEAWLAEPGGPGGPPLNPSPALWAPPIGWSPGVQPASPGRYPLLTDDPAVWTAAGHQSAPAAADSIPPAVHGLNHPDSNLGPVPNTALDPSRESVAASPIFDQQLPVGPAEERSQRPLTTGEHHLIGETSTIAGVRPCGWSPDLAPAAGLFPPHCSAVLTRDTCLHGFWRIQLTDSFVSVCAPRLCGPGRVFIPADQLCHDVREPGLCDDGLRPYLNGSATPVCDCEEGQFRNRTGHCVDLFSTAECEDKQSLHLSKDASLQCAPDLCAGLISHSDGGPKYADIDELCYEYGTRGPCIAGAVLGFSLRLIQPICAKLMEPLFDDDDDDDVVTSRRDGPARLMTSRRDGLVRLMTSPLAGRRQSAFLTGVVRSPLLTRCAAGTRVDSLFTCRDIVFPGRFARRSGNVLPPEQPLFACNQAGRLSADGRCVAPGQLGTPVCRPGEVLDPAGRCRPVPAVGRRSTV